MQVLRYRVKIKLDDFTTYQEDIKEISEENHGKFYGYLTRKIKDDVNFWWEEIERTEDRVMQSSNLRDEARRVRNL